MGVVETPFSKNAILLSHVLQAGISHFITLINSLINCVFLLSSIPTNSDDYSPRFSSRSCPCQTSAIGPALHSPSMYKTWFYCQIISLNCSYCCSFSDFMAIPFCFFFNHCNGSSNSRETKSGSRLHG
jgi:hypothetical protein